MGRPKNIYKPLRNRHGEGKRRYTTIGLNDEVAAELKVLVKAYSEIYGKMTPAQVIKRLIDAGLKRCDPEVFDAFIRLTEVSQLVSGTNQLKMTASDGKRYLTDEPEPVLEIVHQVDPTEGEVWNRKYFFEKDGKKIPAEWAKSEKASFSAKINNRYIGVREMNKNGWTLRNDAGIDITEEQAMVIAQKRRKHQEDIELQRASEMFSSYRDDSSLEEDDPIPESKIKMQKDGEVIEIWLEEMPEYCDEGWTYCDFSEEK